MLRCVFTFFSLLFLFARTFWVVGLGWLLMEEDLIGLEKMGMEKGEKSNG